MKIRQAKASDSEFMHKIHTSAVRETCKDSYTQEQIEAWLKNRSPRGYLEGIEKGEMFVAEENNQVIAFGHAVPGEVVGIFVDPESHKKGIGKMLLQHAIKLATKDNTIIKVEATINAEKFYEKHGFVRKSQSSVIRNGKEIPIIVMEYSPTSDNTVYGVR